MNPVQISHNLASVLETALPRILTQACRDTGNPAYGCFDRNWWHYRIRDFASIILQQGGYTVYTAAKVCNPRLVPADFASKIAAGSCRFWNTRAIRHGAFEEYYPWEQGYPPLAFSTLAVGSANQANNVTFGNYSTLKIRFDEEGNCDKLAVNGVLSLDSASDTLELDIADYDALKPGTYTLATFSSLATPRSRFNNVIKPQGGTLEYTADSIEYTVHPKGMVIIVR